MAATCRFTVTGKFTSASLSQLQVELGGGAGPGRRPGARAARRCGPACPGPGLRVNASMMSDLDHDPDASAIGSLARLRVGAARSSPGPAAAAARARLRRTRRIRVVTVPPDGTVVAAVTVPVPRPGTGNLVTVEHPGRGATAAESLRLAESSESSPSRVDTRDDSASLADHES
jgi:hypothetical protein